jgi:Family of unknown function (DUF6152)
MKRDRIATAWVAALGVLLVGVTAPMFAHHSMSMFNLEKTITLQGTVTEAVWGNPHSLFSCDAKEVDADNAPVRNWSLEAPSPSVMMSKGLKADTIKVGDKITVTGNPRKDGKPSLLLLTLTDANGKRYIVKEPVQ